MKRQITSPEGKVVAVTGGARGIGRATASALIARGARVSIGDLDLELATSTAQDLGPNASAFELDVTDRASFEAFLSATESELGQLDVLVNNAGIMPIGWLVEEDDETSAKTIDVNLWGVINGMKLALPPMLERGEGHIVNMASMVGEIAVPGLAVYVAAKHAVVGLTEAMQEELAGSGVELTAVLPGVVQTELSSGIPTGRGIKLVHPDEVARAIVEAIMKRRRKVFVPRHMRALSIGLAVFPQRLTALVRRFMKQHRTLTQLDAAEREGYARRIAAMPGRGDGLHPGVDAGSGEKGESVRTPEPRESEKQKPGKAADVNQSRE